MKKYYCHYEIDGMHISELNETQLENRYEIEKRRNTYNWVKIYNTITDAIKSLGSYSKEVKLPNGNVIIPDAINYPEMETYYILKPVIFPIYETISA